jgi:hypothetical protein
MAELDWYAWHAGYDQPGSNLARRLAVVRARVAEALDAAPAGPLCVVSMCAGQGRDLLGVLPDHPRRGDVAARLVEIDPANAAIAAATATGTGLRGVEVRVADAACTDEYAGHVPADVVLACGLFGNIADVDVERTVAHLAGFCRPGATVVWTRRRWVPDLIPKMCDWFAAHGFTLHWLSGADEAFGVGMHRYTGPPVPLTPGVRMFTFEKRPRRGETTA